MKTKNKMVVKVQQSISSSDQVKRVLVYDEGRKLFFETADLTIVNPIVERLGDEPKKYFYASVEGKELKLYDEIPDQKW